MGGPFRARFGPFGSDLWYTVTLSFWKLPGQCALNKKRLCLAVLLFLLQVVGGEGYIMAISSFLIFQFVYSPRPEADRYV